MNCIKKINSFNRKALNIWVTIGVIFLSLTSIPGYIYIVKTYKSDLTFFLLFIFFNTLIVFAFTISFLRSKFQQNSFKFKYYITNLVRIVFITTIFFGNYFGGEKFPILNDFIKIFYLVLVFLLSMKTVIVLVSILEDL